MSRAEAIKGLSNRFVFSTFYIYLYLAMALLSLATVVLSLMSDCPTATFYILEILINTTMIAEVSIRLVAFGRQFWSSYYNALDLVITIFCVLTLIVIFFSGCSAKGEEVFDVFLLVVRNLFQFGRLALVLRKSVSPFDSRPFCPANREQIAGAARTSSRGRPRSTCRPRDSTLTRSTSTSTTRKASPANGERWAAISSRASRPRAARATATTATGHARRPDLLSRPKTNKTTRAAPSCSIQTMTTTTTGTTADGLDCGHPIRVTEFPT